jgi:hypothetical protein
MFYNNLISIPILLVASFAFEDWGAANLEQNLYALCIPPISNIIALQIVGIGSFSRSLSLDFHLFLSVTAPRGVSVSPRLPLTGWAFYVSLGLTFC